MVFKIVSVKVPSDKTFVIFGGGAGSEAVWSVGSTFGNTYILAIPRLGYIKFVDSGHDASQQYWSVRFSGSTTQWLYAGTGEATVTVDDTGKFSVTGGANSISGQVTAWVA